MYYLVKALKNSVVLSVCSQPPCGTDSVSGAPLVSSSTDRLSLWAHIFSSSLFWCRSTHASAQALDVHVAADDEDRSCVPSEAIDHSDILAYLNGRGSSCSRRQHTPDRSVSNCITRQ